MNKEWKTIINSIKSWIIEAGKEQVAKLEKTVSFSEKSAAIDLVTEVDIWTEKYLIDKIQSTYPTHSILSEETGSHEGSEGYQWVIDPIDGTTNYAHGFPFFCISVGVKYNGETIIGVVYAPKLNDLYLAVKGQGAYVNDRSLAVSNRNELHQALVGTGFPYDRATNPENNLDHFVNIVTKIRGVRRTGSAALDLCQVAAGRFDGFWEFGLHEWDFAAGRLMIEEAGGRTRAVPKERGYYVLAGNHAIFHKLDDLIHDTYK
ncbi:inositol monophosphatase family protein [Pseudalkalibacillus caeni]|uniref:Inositol-1-monophosphatase n=1 Tax=Exobacillus caeni TaxID=2574798 RepID=A0A5R9FDS9_9BACL|nr:inositol monophosphatase family protein [Pseudalkalibacillus caeni]TLS38714.1 inositol monophosphatase [Pseudalkalibacillus caeni]